MSLHKQQLNAQPSVRASLYMENTETRDAVALDCLGGPLPDWEQGASILGVRARRWEKKSAEGN